MITRTHVAVSMFVIFDTVGRVVARMSCVALLLVMPLNTQLSSTHVTCSVMHSTHVTCSDMYRTHVTCSVMYRTHVTCSAMHSTHVTCSAMHSTQRVLTMSLMQEFSKHFAGFVKLFSQWRSESGHKVDWSLIKPPPAEKACMHVGVAWASHHG